MGLEFAASDTELAKYIALSFNDFNHSVTIKVADHISHIAGELHCTEVLEPFSLIMSLSEV